MSLGELKRNLRNTTTVFMKDMRTLLGQYTDKDWKENECWNNDKYTRILLDRKEGIYDLVLFCWKPKQESPIHNHPGTQCLMKILEGELYEQRYQKPEDNVREAEQFGKSEMVQYGKTTLYGEGDITYISGEGSLHRVGNIGPKNTVTLHLYHPPFPRCTVFDYENSTMEEQELTGDENFNPSLEMLNLLD